MKENITIKGWDSDELRLIANVAIGGESTTVLLEPDFDEMTTPELENYISRAEDRIAEIGAGSSEETMRDEIENLIDVAQNFLNEKMGE